MANHSGLLPLDAALTLRTLAVHRPEAQKLVAFLGRAALSRVPRWLVPGIDLRAGGPAEALVELRQGSAVLVFPEGRSAAGQTLWSGRDLALFGRGGFVRVALQAGAPIVPVRVDGGEKAFPVLTQIPFLARWLKLPSFPVTPFFPWLGPLGLLPLPVRWSLRVAEAVVQAPLGPTASDDDRIIDEILLEVRRRLDALAQAPRSG